MAAQSGDDSGGLAHVPLSGNVDVIKTPIMFNVWAKRLTAQTNACDVLFSGKRPRMVELIT